MDGDTLDEKERNVDLNVAQEFAVFFVVFVPGVFFGCFVSVELLSGKCRRRTMTRRQILQ